MHFNFVDKESKAEIEIEALFVSMKADLNGPNVEKTVYKGYGKIDEKATERLQKWLKIHGL